MTAEELIDTLEQRALLPADVIASLRQQVAKSLKIVTPESLAKLLVDKGRLTSFQAEQLLKPAPTKRPAAAADEEMMMLAPLDDMPAKRSQPAAKKPATEAPAASKAAPATTQTGKRIEGKKIDAPAAKASPAAAKPATPSAAPQAARAPGQTAATKGASTTGNAAPAAKPKPGAPAAKEAKSSRNVELEPLTAADDFGLGASAAGALDDMLGGVSLEEASLGEAAADLSAGSLAPVARRSAPVPKLVWIAAGGGALLVLLIVGVLIAVSRSNGDAEWQLAEKDFTAGSDQEAIVKLDAFLEKFPNHPRAGAAAVYRGMARLRQAIATKTDWEQPLAVASEALPRIVDQPDYAKIRDALGKTLPEMAAGLAQQAKEGAKAPLDQRRHRTAAAQQGLALAKDPRYTADAQKPWSLLQTTETEVALLARAVDRDAQLEAATGEIRTAIAAGNMSAAFARRDQLLEAFPELRLESSIEQLDQELAQGAAKAIKIDTERRKAEIKPLPSPVVSTIIYAARNDKLPADASKLRELAPSEKATAVAVFTNGTAYWLDAADGVLLGRAFLGFDSCEPSPLASSGGSDFIVYDAVHQELARVSARLAALHWRQPLGEPLAETPFIAGESVFAITRTGRLLMLDTESGDVLKAAQFSETFSVGPALSADGSVLYLTSDRDDVFVVAIKDFHCSAATSLGNDAGNVTMPPVVFGKFIALVQSQDFDNSTLRFLSAPGADGAVKTVERIPLAGRVNSTPIVNEATLVVATDRGAVMAFADTSQAGGPPKKVAELPAAESRWQPDFVAAQEDHFWLGGDRVAQYEMAKAGDAPHLDWERMKGDRVLQPPVAAGKLLIVVHSHPGVPGVRVTAVDAGSGEPRWETALAVPLAGSPLADADGKMVRAIHPLIGESETGAIPGESQVVTVAPLSAPSFSPPSYAVAAAPWGAGKLAVVTGSSIDAKRRGEARLMFVDPKTQALLPSPWSDAIASTPVALGDGVLVCDQAGQVLVVNPETGEPLAAPFIPKIGSGSESAWRKPGIVAGKKEAVLTDGRMRIYRLGVKDQPAPALTALAEEALAAPIVSGVAVNGEFAFGADESGKLTAFNLADLKPAQSWSLDAAALWGPARVGDSLLVATDRELFCFDAKPELRWKKSLPAGPPIGDALEQDGELLFATATGAIWRVDPTTGEEKGRLDIGQPLASGPVTFQKHLIVAAADGSLLIIKGP